MKGKKLKRRLSMLLSSMLAATCILNSIPVGAVSSRSVIEDNIALGCSYEASVASHGSYPDSGGELTDGQIGIYLSNPQKPLIFQGFTPIFRSNLIYLPLFLPLRAETRATFYSPPTAYQAALRKCASLPL